MNNRMADSTLLRTVLLLASCLVFTRAIATGMHPIDTLAISDNDDIMRFLSIRDWLAGQSWFDTTQYRMVPPEGLDLHWSRYVDLGIAAIIWPLSLVMPMPQAEAIALVAWPTGLFLVLIFLTAFAARKLFGEMTAILSVLALVLWPPTGLTYFAPARIDHHNVQILLTTAMVISVLWPRPSLKLGILGGSAAAMSIAVGLETLITIALAGMVLVVRTILIQPHVSRQLAAFSLTLFILSAVLFAGQTAPSDWFKPLCDELSLPFLALAGVGALICVLMIILTPKIQNLSVRFGVLFLVSAAGIASISPLIAPCVGGPYGDLPQEVQDLISGRILEARPTLPWLLAGNDLAFRFVAPAAMAVFLATALWIWRVLTAHSDRDVTVRLGILLAFGWLGVIGAMFQIRLVLMGAAAIPLLTGFVIAHFFDLAKARGSAYVAIPMLLVAVLGTLMAPTIFNLAKTTLASQSSGAEQSFLAADSCRDPELLRSLNDIPSGLILSSSSFGAPLLLLTDHSVLAGPYHRSADAIANGALPFDGDEQEMRRALFDTGADYLLLCRNAKYGDGTSFATKLAAGVQGDALIEVPSLPDNLLLLQVLQER